MAVGVAYQTYQLSQEGNLEASYPDYEEEVTVTHIYNKTDFCLIYLQVLLSSFLPCNHLPPLSNHSFLAQLHWRANS